MFSLLIGGGGLLGHLYLYRLVRQLAPDRRWRLGLGAFLILMTMLLLLRPGGRGRLERRSRC